MSFLLGVPAQTGSGSKDLGVSWHRVGTRGVTSEFVSPIKSTQERFRVAHGGGFGSAPTGSTPAESSSETFAATPMVERTNAGELCAMDGSDSRELVTELMERASSGDRRALDELVEVLYDELRAIAEERRARWRGDDTLSATVLVNEAYLRLAKQVDPEWDDRAHFKAVASTAMRQILVDYSRRRSAQKRGAGAWDRLTFDRVADLFSGLGGPPAPPTEALIELDAALKKLEVENPQYGRIVECRFFGEMTIAETAEALEISPATVKRGWNLAQAWLHRELEER